MKKQRIKGKERNGEGKDESINEVKNEGYRDRTGRKL